MNGMKMILTRTAVAWLALLLLVVVSGCGGGGGNGGPPPDTTPPSVTNSSVSPTSLTPTGGAVTIQATATDNVAVQSVSAVITGYNPATQTTGTWTVALTRSSGDTWSKQHTIAAISPVSPGLGDANGETRYTVAVTATDTSGNKSTPANTSFKIIGLPPTIPKTP